MQKDPKAAAQKYGQNPKFRDLMMEFSQLMGTHFSDVADKQQKEEEEAKRKEEEEKRKQEEIMKSDPVFQVIQNDSQVKDTLADPKVQLLIKRLQTEGGLDFHEVARQDPATA